MKRIIQASIAFLIIFSFAFVGVKPAQADSSWPNPTATPLTGDTSFTATPTDPASLAGAYTGANGLVLPTGFKEGEKQFGGSALVLTGIDFGTQKLCFSFPTYSAGWRGDVYQWSADKWIKLATTVTEGSDGSYAMACATAYGNGSYALIIGLTEAAGLPTCQMGIGASTLNHGAEGSIFELSFIMGEFPAEWLGKTVSFKIVAVPSDAAWGDGLADSGQVVKGSLAGPDDYSFWTDQTFFVDESRIESLTVHITLPTCQSVVHLGGGVCD
jgi:hypothetical protein